jgi:mycothiol synthase
MFLHKGEFQLNIEILKQPRIIDFINFCKKHRNNLDDSFLYDEDLEKFQPNNENPTYIITNDIGDIIGAVSLIIDDYHKRGRKSRFRIMHSERCVKEDYEFMLSAALAHTESLNKLFLFIKEENNKVAEILQSLNFNIERYAVLLQREDLDITPAVFPEDYSLKTFRQGEDENAWCEVRNAAFANLAGSETPMTPDMVSKMLNSNNNLNGGMLILYHKDNPVGVVRASKEFENGETYTFIGPIAVKPEYQHMGLGKNLLRAALNYGKSQGMPKAMLTANADNFHALDLYFKEEFKKIECVVCYNYNIE